MHASRYKVLFFIPHVVPTQEEKTASYQFGPNCSFRCVRFIDLDNAIEDADAVAGDVPPQYAARYPLAVPIGEWFARPLAGAADGNDAAGGQSDPFVTPEPASKPRRGRAWQPNS